MEGTAAIYKNQLDMTINFVKMGNEVPQKKPFDVAKARQGDWWAIFFIEQKRKPAEYPSRRALTTIKNAGSSTASCQSRLQRFRGRPGPRFFGSSGGFGPAQVQFSLRNFSSSGAMRPCQYR